MAFIPAQPLLTNRTQLLIREESVYGTINTPNPLIDAFAVMDLDLRPIGNVVQRQFMRASLTPLGQVIAGRLFTCTFTVELKSGPGAESGTLAPRVGRLFRAGGYSEAATLAGTSTGGWVYRPVSGLSEVGSCTIYAYLDGTLHRIAGWRCNPEAMLPVGDFAKLRCTGEGLFVDAASDAALPNISLESTLPLIPKSLNVNLKPVNGNTITPVMQAFNFNNNNGLVRRPDVNAADSYISILITSRDPQIQINPDYTLVADHPWWENWNQVISYGTGFSLGSTPGNRVQFAAPAAQFIEPNYGDREGIRTFDSAARLTGTNDDECVWTFR